MNPRTLVLIEPNATSLGGHWTATLVGLAQAARHTGVPVTVVCPNGLEPGAAHVLRQAGTSIRIRPSRGDLLSRAYLAGASLCRWASRVSERAFPRRRFPHQITLLARCLVEAAALRIGRDTGRQTAAVILTASEGLHGLAAKLSGTAHLRVIHDVYTTEDAAVRALSRLARAAERSVLAVCTTEGVAEDFRRAFPHITVVVRPFATIDPDETITDAERSAARTALGVPADGFAVALVGGWWAQKDMATVVDALVRVTAPVHVLVAGSPVDTAALQILKDRSNLTVRATVRALQPDEVRQVYAASDATIVSRPAGVTKESGLVIDAIRFGVPLIISDHDPLLSKALAEEPWVRQFAAGDAESLATVVDAVRVRRLPRPAPGTAALLGVSTSVDAVAFYLAHGGSDG